MVDPSADRRERRNWWAGVAVITAFVLLGGGGLGYGLYQPSASAAEPESEEPTPQVQLLTASFVDERKGHVVVAICTDPSDASTCETELRATTDAGESWQRRTLPQVDGAPVGLDTGFEIYSLGTDRIVIDAPGGFTASTGQSSKPGYRFYSGDGGQNWEKRSRTPDGAVTEVPENGWLFYPVPDPTDRSAEVTAVEAQVLRPDGTSATLTKAPQYAAPSVTAVLFASDDSIWAVGAEPASLSRDHGRSWQKIPTPKLDAGQRSIVRTADGVHAYAIAAASEGFVGLWATDDGGKKWRELTLPEPSGSATSADVYFAEVVDGTFLMLRGGSLYQYKPGATSAAEVRLAGVTLTGMWAFPHGVAARSGDADAAIFYITVDGSHWMPIALRVGG